MGTFRNGDVRESFGLTPRRKVQDSRGWVKQQEEDEDEDEEEEEEEPTTPNTIALQPEGLDLTWVITFVMQVLNQLFFFFFFFSIHLGRGRDYVITFGLGWWCLKMRWTHIVGGCGNYVNIVDETWLAR